MVFSGERIDCVQHFDAAPPFAQTTLTLLIHGLGRTSRAMRPAAHAFSGAGHATACLDYASTRTDLGSHIDSFSELIRDLPDQVQRIHFLTHSLGGIICRGLLARPELRDRLRASRVVMLAPPNRGAALASLLRKKIKLPFEGVMGPSGIRMAEAHEDRHALESFPEPSVPTLVIAGGAQHGRGYNPLIEGDDDGIVAVSETYLREGEHQLVTSLHTTIMRHAHVHRAALAFLFS